MYMHYWYYLIPEDDQGRSKCVGVMVNFVYKMCFNLTFMGFVHRNNILPYIQQDATLHSLFYLETALHVLGGTTTHHQERKQLYL
jgi:hypothetical protein